MYLTEKPELLMRTGRTSRFHTTRMVFPQDTAQHSYNCALIARYIIQELKKKTDHLVSDIVSVDESRVCTYLLYHDAGEYAFGDIPGHVKNLYEGAEDREREAIKMLPGLEETEVFSLTKVEKYIASFVDTYECALTCKRELEVGNRELEECFENCLLSLQKKATYGAEMYKAYFIKDLVRELENWNNYKRQTKMMC